MKATAISKPINAVKTPNVTKCATNSAVPRDIICHAKPAITFNKVCPAIMFANNRTDKLIIRDICAISSIGTINGASTKLTPAG